MTKLTTNMICSIQRKFYNKAPEIPATPAPVAAAPTPTTDNSEEVKKQRLLEEQRAMRAKGLSSTDNTGGEGVPLTEENIEKPKATTLLGG